MTDDPWLSGAAQNPAPIAPTANPAEPKPCWRCERGPSTTWCRVCWRPLCADCRIDHYHEGYP
ncbi:hypothetical protein ACGF07_25660 [Kitasatospora sp. NPDC048194]|uniref:hypothetical protein n=1 Tax=Kitasatospora sp. NPDC048194 TaxID=3364045 RepID=UPI0037176A2B